MTEPSRAASGVAAAAAPKVVRSWLVTTALAVTVILWASAFVGIRAASKELEAGTIAFGRLLIGALVLGVALRAVGGSPPPRRAWRPLLICGVVWFGVYNLALNQGERLVDPGTAATVVNIAPVLIALLAGVFLGEGFPPGLFVGGAMAFVGVAVIGSAASSAEAAPPAGVVLCVCAAVAYAVGAVSQKRALSYSSALPVTWACCVIGAATCLPFARSALSDVLDAPAGPVAWLVYLGVLPTAVAFSTWSYALSRASAGSTGATTYLVPPAAALLGWVLLDETLPRMSYVGAVICLAGVAVTRWRHRTRPSAATPEENQSTSRRLALSAWLDESEVGTVQLLVIETFRHGPGPVYERATRLGRMLPDGIDFVASWIVDDDRLDRCFQILETDRPELLAEWQSHWDDLIAFEVLPVISSAEVSARLRETPGS